MARLKQSFFLGSDVLRISRQLLGKHIFTRIGSDETTGGIIVETEAYAGIRDRASHAYGGRRTPRTEPMFREGGIAYVYLCYGLHALFNIVTNRAGVPDAVLIRAIEPTHGLGTMLRRRGRRAVGRDLAGGPARLTRALGIETRHDGISLTGRTVWLEDRGGAPPPAGISAGPRVGVAYAGPDASRPWRFCVKDSPWTSTPSSSNRT